MKRKKYNIDLKGWSLGAAEELQSALDTCFRKAIEEALGLAFEDDETYIYFPALFCRSDGIGGKKVSDPLTMYLRVGLESEEEKPTYEFNLRVILADEIEQCKEDGSYSEELERISSSLRSLADDIDAARSEYSEYGDD